MKNFIRVMLVILISLFGVTSCAGDTGGNSGNDGGDTGGGDIGIVSPPDTSGSDASGILIAYFSCTETTEGIAKHIEAETNGTLYRIMPEVPYTADDLRYYTDCRADREQADSSARPAISGSVEDMENYGIVFLGYPIWHGQAPRIISTFLESYDFSDKTIVPFCTSHSSGIGSSDTNLHSLAPSAEWAAGKRFPSGASQQAVGEWIDGLDLKLTPNDTEQEEISEMFITVNGNKLKVALEKNSAATALVDKLKQGDVTYTANDYGGFEKVGGLGFSLPTNDARITTQAGDVILYSGNQIVLFYGSNTWEYTRLGRIEGYSASELQTLFGSGSSQVTISLT